MTLAAYLEKHGLSEASRRLGIGRMTLWRWANGKTQIAPIHRKYLAQHKITVAEPRKKHQAP